MFMRFIHVGVCNSKLFLTVIYIDILFPIDEHLGCFQNFAIINDVAMNIIVHVPWTVMAGLWVSMSPALLDNP